MKMIDSLSLMGVTRRQHTTVAEKEIDGQKGKL